MHPIPFALPVRIAGYKVALEPLDRAHAAALIQAAADGALWQLRYTSVPEPDAVENYIESALAAQQRGERCCWAVREEVSDRIVGCTSYHDILADVRRVEIGYTWYAASVQRTHVNTACKLLLMTHAFERLNCRVVGWRTNNVNFASQRAIERLGAKRDGVIRAHALCRDGSVRDTVLYSVTQQEWFDQIKARITWLLLRERG